VILPPRHRNPYSSHVSYLAQTRKTTPVMFNSGECILPAALGSTLKSAVYTDNMGGDEMNQTLSENRAALSE
jgi:hypothetical protein